MKNKSILILSLFILLPFMLLSQNKSRGGIHGSYIGNYNPFVLHVSENIGSTNLSYVLSSPDIFPTPEQSLKAYQFGFLNAKKDWHDFRFSFIYMPETTKSYSKIKYANGNWLDLAGTEIVSKNMELYQMNMSHIYKLNLMLHRIYLLAGFGGGGGVIRWPSYNSEGSDLYFLTYYAYPIAGIEIKLLKRLALTGEYHYQYGETNTQTVSVTGGKTIYNYEIEGHELSVGVNIYF